MNIYDFDDTIYDGDSGFDFIVFCLKKMPLKVLGSAIKTIPEAIKYLFKKSNVKILKEKIFSYIHKIDNFDELANEFADKYKDRIKKWYEEQREVNDVIISASMDFYLVPLCNKLNLKNLICTNYDMKTGHIIGNNCKGVEKIERLKKHYDITKVKYAYSDSLTDAPMFDIAEKGYIVKKDKLIEYKKDI